MKNNIRELTFQAKLALIGQTNSMALFTLGSMFDKTHLQYFITLKGIEGVVQIIEFTTVEIKKHKHFFGQFSGVKSGIFLIIVFNSEVELFKFLISWTEASLQMLSETFLAQNEEGEPDFSLVKTNGILIGAVAFGFVFPINEVLAFSTLCKESFLGKVLKTINEFENTIKPSIIRVVTPNFWFKDLF